MSVMASSRALGLAERDKSVRSGGARAAPFVIKSDVMSNIIGEGRLGRVVTRAEVVVGGWRKGSAATRPMLTFGWRLREYGARPAALRKDGPVTALPVPARG